MLLCWVQILVGILAASPRLFFAHIFAAEKVSNPGHFDRAYMSAAHIEMI
jgi:hypothetical protein